MYACETPSFFAKYGRNAKSAENYGGNTQDEGYTNMVDLGDLVHKSQNILPEYSQAVIETLEECVVYNINGSYRSKSSGLSCYYPYSSDPDSVIDFGDISASDAYYYLYEYEIMGELSNDGLNYISTIEFPKNSSIVPDVQEIKPVPNINTLELENFPIYVDDDEYAVLDIGTDISDYLYIL